MIETAFNCLATDRRFPVTEKGYMGWCPENCIPGDFVTVLEGGPVPIILRPTAGDEQYVVVGDAYIHGIMDGEAFDICTNSDLRVEGLVLV
jgi:hypothetical protein